jgi:hypothetical protein
MEKFAENFLTKGLANAEKRFSARRRPRENPRPQRKNSRSPDCLTLLFLIIKHCASIFTGRKKNLANGTAFD